MTDDLYARQRWSVAPKYGRGYLADAPPLRTEAEVRAARRPEAEAISPAQDAFFAVVRMFAP